jgi:hypothetical protein
MLENGISLKKKYEILRKGGSKYAETIILGLFTTAIPSLFSKIPYIIVTVIYGIFLILYVAWSLMEHYYSNKPCGTRIFLHVLCPLSLSSALFAVFQNISSNIIGIDTRTLWNSGVIFTFIFLSISFSLIGAIVYRIVRVVTDPNKQVVYATTCIPVAKTSDNEITFLLINNRSHNSSAWMFPGGHIKIDDNFIKDDDKEYINKLYDLPVHIIMKKCVDEANININIIDFIRNRCINDSDLFSSEECSQTISPIFNMVFQVSKHAKCYEQFGHRVHYDFTYIAKYTKLSNERSNYKCIEVHFGINGFSFDNAKKNEEISTIGAKIYEKIGRGDRYKLFLSSIPLLIYETLKLFNEDKKRLEII